MFTYARKPRRKQSVEYRTLFGVNCSPSRENPTKSMKCHSKHIAPTPPQEKKKCTTNQRTNKQKNDIVLNLIFPRLGQIRIKKQVRVSCKVREHRCFVLSNRLRRPFRVIDTPLQGNTSKGARSNEHNVWAFGVAYADLNVGDERHIIKHQACATRYILGHGERGRR